MSKLQTVEIDAMGAQGEGIVMSDGQRLFVPFVLPGEKVRVVPEGERATLMDIVSSSAERVAPSCTHFGECGGCQTQHWAVEPYQAWKRDLVVEALLRAGLDVEVGALVSAHGEGRRRATLHATRDLAGFAVRRSHEIHSLDSCPILVPALRQAPRIAREAAKLAGPCDVSFTATDSGIDIAIRTKNKKTAKINFAPLANHFKLARVEMNGELQVLMRQPVIVMGPTRINLPADTFLQATAEAESILGDLVLEAAKGAKRVIDLFCGVGPFALRLATMAQTYAVDANKSAVAACDVALRATPGLKVLGTEVRDLFRDPLIPMELKPFDTAVFDPPRAGAEAQVRELVKSKVKRIVAVSCDPQSFARDARILVDAGFKLQSVTPVDQFLYSPHVELVAAFKR